MYNYNHLYYFYMTVKSKGVMSAARHLNVSQPSLTSQLKVLEGALDIKLFQKVGRKNELTQQGLAIFGYCRQMFEASEEMREAIQQRLPTATRRIYIGVSEEVERSFVVEIVSQFLLGQSLDARPKVIIVSGTEDQLTERLKFRELDIIITELAIKDPDLMNLGRIETPVVLACSKKWKLKSKSRNIKASAAIKEIVGGENAQWLMPSTRFKLRSEIDTFFEMNELKGRIVFESDVMASLVRAAQDAIGLGLFPLLYIAREVKEKKIQTLGPKNGYWKYRLWLVCHKHKHEDQLMKSFAKSFSEVGGSPEKLLHQTQ